MTKMRRLEPDDLRQVSRQLSTESTIRNISSLLGTKGIPFIVLKGPHLGHELYDDPLERPYVDLDILVRPTEHPAAGQCLTRGGFRKLHGPEGRTASMREHYCEHFLSPLGVPVELHWDLSSHGRFPVDFEGMFARASIVKLGQADALVPGTEDLLLSLCIHVIKSHFLIEEKHIQDIALLVRKRRVDWETFRGLVYHAQCRAGAYYVLESAKTIHAAEIPEHVLDDLEPGLIRKRWLDSLLHTDRFPLVRGIESSAWWARLVIGLPIIDRSSTRRLVALRYITTRMMDIIEIPTEGNSKRD